MVQYYIWGGIILSLIYVSYQTLRKDKIKTIPDHWDGVLSSKVDYYSKLNKEKKEAFRYQIKDFLNQVYIEGVQLELSELDKLLVAASAIIPVFGFDGWKYRNLKTVLLYPDYFNKDLDFNQKSPDKNIAGLVGTGHFNRQMILSRRALHLGFTNARDKRNTAIHEFVHLLDMIDGMTDGIPRNLLLYQYTIPWLHLMHDEMKRIQNDQSSIRPYGGTSEAEFFAVVSEYFFERPNLFKKNHPELYEILSTCFNQNLSSREL